MKGEGEGELALSTHWHPYAAYVLPTPETSPLEGEREEGGGGGAAAHVGIQFYTNLLLFLPKRARSLGNFHSFCSRHTQ